MWYHLDMIIGAHVHVCYRLSRLSIQNNLRMCCKEISWYLSLIVLNWLTLIIKSAENYCSEYLHPGGVRNIAKSFAIYFKLLLYIWSRKGKYWLTYAWLNGKSLSQAAMCGISPPLLHQVFIPAVEQKTFCTAPHWLNDRSTGSVVNYIHMLRAFLPLLLFWF